MLCLLSAIGLLSFPDWREETDELTGSTVDVKPFPSRLVSSATAASLGFASALAFGSAVWQHTSAASIACLAETMSQSQVNARVGTAAVALVWIPVFLIALAFLAMAGMIVAIIIFNKSIED